MVACYNVCKTLLKNIPLLNLLAGDYLFSMTVILEDRFLIPIYFRLLLVALLNW